MPETVTALAFLEACYGTAETGVLPLFLLPSKTLLWGRPGALKPLLCAAKPFLATHDMYFGLGLQAKPAAVGRGQAEDIIGIPGLWCDLDIADPVHRIQQLPPTHDAAQDVLDTAIPFPPSVVIDSGHGLQAYWLFREVWMLNTPDERTAAGTLCQRLQQAIQLRAQAQGWHVDSTFDLARIFRLPGTMNRKREPVPVRGLVWEPTRRYEPGDFDDLLPSLTHTCVVPPPSQQAGGVPPLHALQISIRMKYLLRVGEDPVLPARYPSRSEAVFAVLTALMTGGYSDAQITQILRDPLYALAAKPTERGTRWLGQEIARARTKWQPQSQEIRLEGHAPIVVCLGEGRS